MSNHRRSGLKNLYRTEFLRSPAWFARRERWFHHHTHDGVVTCPACGIPGTKAQLELHHLDYQGVRIVKGEWEAGELDADLVAMHPYCHELLHRLIERDVVLTKHRSRREANDHAMRTLQVKLQKWTEAS